MQAANNTHSITETDPFEGLKERAYNVVQMNKLKNVSLFIEYYKRHGNFLSLRHCGAITNTELTAFAEKLMPIYELSRTMQFRVSTTSDAQLQENGEVKRTQFSPEAIRLYHEMSSRCKNVLHINGISTAAAFIDYFKAHRNFMKLRHCGRMTSAQLVEIAESMLERQQELKQ